MVGTLSVVGSSMLDSGHSGPCLCLDAMPYSMVNLMKGAGEMAPCQSSARKKQLCRQTGGLYMDLRSSFIDSGRASLGVVSKCSVRRPRKARRPVIVNEIGGQYEDTFEDVKKQMLNYFTCKAVRTVLHQLYEMNPPQYRWFYDFVVSNNPADGKRFLRTLGKEQHNLAERVMLTRLHLYGKWVKKCNHTEIYKEMSDENLELMRQRLIETVIWPSDDTNTEKIG